MKTFITFLLLTIALYTKAQNVNIPDANFKAILISMGIDMNNDGDIQISEAEAVTSINLTGAGSSQISDLTGIHSFSNIQELDCSNQLLSVVDVAGLENLKKLYCSNSELITLNTTGCINLEWLLCNNTKVRTIDVSNFSKLDSVDASGNDSLEIFNAENCSRLRAVNLTGASVFNYKSIDMVNLVNCDSLINLSIYNRNITILNISQSDKIEGIYNFGGIANLVANNCTSLKYIVSSSGSNSSIYGSIDVTGCTNLIWLQTGELNYLTHVDLSTCPNLKTLFTGSQRSLYVNIKNGSLLNNWNIVVADGNNSDNITPVLNICADDFEIDSVYNRIESQYMDPLTPYNINSYCSFTPAGSYNTINGKVNIDMDNNGCDNTDRSMSYVPIKITDTAGRSLIRYSGGNGSYFHYPYKGSFTLTPYFPYPYYVINPSSATVNFDTANSLNAIRDFCIQPNGVHNDLEITFLPASPAARPGFNAAYTLVYKNRGTTTLSGNVSVNFDNNKMSFVSASENVATQSSGQVQWNYNNLLPFESRTINVTFSLLPPPVNNIEDTISFLAVITPSDNDETAFDNIFILPQRVIGSFDPNDKQCLEGSKLDISKIGDYLHYQIRFQNEGTDTAFNIVVVDTLSDNLDWSTFEFIASSHACDPQLKNNKAEFFFKDINLPHKAINEPASNGWIAFKIKPKPSVVIGDSINNSAAIYFDFNLPVITNTATTIVSNISTPVPVKMEYFSVNKKVNANQLNWKASCTYGNASFIIERSDDGVHFKSIGNITATSLRCQLPFNFMDNNPVAGKNYYRLKISDGYGKSFYSKTLVVGNNKAGIEITAVANNVVYLNSNKQQIITMKVIAADGREVLNQKQTVSTGNNNINLKMQSLSRGIYSLIIYSEEGETITKRFIQ